MKRDRMKKRFIVSIVFIASICALALYARAECPVTFPSRTDNLQFTTEYYDLSSNTYDGLMDEIDDKGIKAKDGKTYPGYTSFEYYFYYYYRYEYRRNPTSRGDEVSIDIDLYDLEVKKTIVVTLPRLADGVSLSGRDMKMWTDFTNSLQKHEMDHVIADNDPRIDERYAIEMDKIEGTVDVVVRQGQEIDNEFVLYLLEKKIKPIRYKITGRVQEVNDRLDELTGHGLKPFDREKFLVWSGDRILCAPL